MFQENEAVTLLLGMGTLIFVIAFLPRLLRLQRAYLLLVAFTAQFVSWLFTVLETWYFPDLFNLIEHLGYAISTVSLLTWVWFHAKHPEIHA